MLPTVIVVIFTVVQLFGVAAVERVLARLEVSSVKHIRYMLRRVTVIKSKRRQTSPIALVRRLQQ